MKPEVYKIAENLRKFLKTSSILFMVFMLSVNAQAQVKDSVKVKQEKEHKNTVKINLTSFAIYNGFQVNYERLLTKKSSITVWGGPIQFPMPDVIDNSSLKFTQNKQRSGFTFGADYRFYLASENKYSAPRGVYLAPYISYYDFNNQRNGRDTSNNLNVSLSTTLDLFNVGGELGYQFVVKKRFVIDCILLGPSLTSYYWAINLNGDVGNLNEQQQAILEALINKFPLLKDLSGDKKISGSGISNFWSVGFRYAIHIGYRF